MPSSAAHPLDRVFKARSVAFVGVSADPAKTSGTPLRNLLRHRFAGRVLLVNPRHAEIEGIACFPSIEALPEAPDCAFVSLAAERVPAAVEACGRRGIRACVILSSGFEEAAGGRPLAEALARAAARHGVLLVGPNSEGVWAVRERVILTFGSAAKRDSLVHGPVAALTQSGGVGAGIVRQLMDGGYGASYFVSVGNEANLGIADYVDYLAGQEDVRTILMFVEGLKRGRRLIDAAARARSRGIALVALKSGDSARGREATASHTGKISSAGEVYRDVLHQAGAIRVESLVDLVDAGKVLTYLPRPPRRGRAGGLCILSVLGGPRSIMADACERLGVPLATYAPETAARLAGIVPAFGYVPNPTDITGQVVGNPELLKLSLEAVAGDPNVEAILIQFGNGGLRDVRERRDLFVDLARRTGLPVVLSLIGDSLEEPLKVAYARDGIAVARDGSEGIRFLSWLWRAREFAGREAEPGADAWIGGARAPVPRGWAEGAAWLGRAGIAVPRFAVLEAGADAAAACAGLAFPVALKALPEDSDHKSERGLVALALVGPAEVAGAARSIRARLGRADATLLVQEMAGPGVEAVVSVRRDPDFGPVLALGAGGVMVELLRDAGFLALPCSRAAVARLVGRLRLGALLAGFRGAPPADTDALIDAALALGRAFVATEGASEVEINPLLVRPRGQGVVALDLLVK